ncbi:MAG: HAMP domain-containing protein [Chthoniobacterales bacterium]|nr:HAMP domain-containing protein [Chthoniobacterales bacterium]
MRPRTLRGRIALWSAAVATAALVLFGVAAAWNLRRELVENLDQQIQDEAADFAAEMDEQQVQTSQGEKAMTFSSDDLPRFPFVEVRGATQRLLYRAPALGNLEVIPAVQSRRPYQLKAGDRLLRFARFHRGGITYAVGKDLDNVEEALAGLLRSYFIAFPLVVIAIGVGGWWIADRAVAPITTIAVRAANISASDLSQRLPDTPAQDEIGDLTLVLNAMFDRLQRSFEQVTRFTSNASHEMKTPLTLMRAEVENALESPALAPEPRELLENLGEQCSRLSLIVDALLLLSRADDRRLALEQTRFDLVRLVRELMEDAEILAEPARLSLECELPNEIPVFADRRLLARAVMNLLDNAIKHNETAGRVRVAAARENGQAVLRIGNTGRGLPRETGEQIFERFFRGDPSHSDETPGHGLGLSIAREIARAHGGDVQLAHSDSKWTEFCLVLPINSAS